MKQPELTEFDDSTGKTLCLEFNGVDYTVPEHIDFVRQVHAAGRFVTMYHGRFFYHGPAVVCDSTSAMVSLGITCPVQSDSLGLGSIIYSTVSDPTLSTAHESIELDHACFCPQAIPQRRRVVRGC